MNNYNETRESLKNHCSCQNIEAHYCCEFIKMLNCLKRKYKDTQDNILGLIYQDHWIY
jgi:hypothetical protein